MQLRMHVDCWSFVVYIDVENSSICGTTVVPTSLWVKLLQLLVKPVKVFLPPMISHIQ